MTYQEMLAQIRANPKDSGFMPGTGWSSGGGDGGMGDYTPYIPFEHTGSYMYGGKALSPLGTTGNFAVYDPAPEGKISQLNGTSYEIIDGTTGNVVGQGKWQGLKDFNAMQDVIGALAVAFGGPLLGGALAGAAAAGAGAGAGAGAVGSAEAGAVGYGGTSSMGGGLLGGAGGGGYGALAMPAVEGAAAGLPALATYGGVPLAEMGAWSAAGGAAAGAAGGSMMGEPPPANPNVSNPSLTSQVAQKLGISETTAEGLMKSVGSAGINQLLGGAATAIGGLLGAQGQDQSATSTRSMDPRVAQSVYGTLLPKSDALLNAQDPIAQQYGAQMGSVGQGLLNTKLQPDFNSNPYMQATANDMQRRTSDLLGQNNLQIQGNSVATGGLGGSRQGVAQGVAAGKAADNLQGNLATMYMGQYNTDYNRNLQQVTLGAGLMNQGLDTAWQPIKNAAGVMSPFSGYGTTTQAGSSGGGAQGLLGGALGAAQLAKNFGWWGSGSSGSASGSGGTAGYDWTGSGGQNIF